MRALVQLVDRAQVTVEDELISKIGKGFLVLLGAGEGDTGEEVAKLWRKISRMRIFEDADGKTNLSLSDVGGALLIVPQFTLYADCRKGNRPSFTKALEPGRAEQLYEAFMEHARSDGFPVQGGRFGAEMEVELVNHGPFTIWLDTDAL
ncbi:MAG: D-tyrosyl-tRNA(Tyr) deacylase [Coriobacteriales bacterium]|nr:D-tyrosyl-tRNA(Tyr) deacylase [Coriobacteriales bacterium]